MFKSLLESAKASPFASPFQAKCDDGLKVNENRLIAAAAAGIYTV